MFKQIRMKLFVVLLFGLLAGCTSRIEPLPVTNSSHFEIQSVAHVPAAGPLAISSDGRLVAWGDNDLNLQNLQTGQHLHLLSNPPETLCWSPDGLLLATTISRGGKSSLHVFNRSGHSVYYSQLSGRVERLRWPVSGRLTAGVLSLQVYRFGTQMRGQLLQWDRRWRVTKIPLYETTITPAMNARLAGHLYETFDYDLSPLTDEVLYTRLHAPPSFSATRHLVLRNLQTNAEKELFSLPLLSGTGRLAADGESAFIIDGPSQIRLQNLWTAKILRHFPGTRLDYDATSGLLIAAGRLYQGRQLLLKLPRKSQVRLSTGGHFLLVRWQEQLYRISQYPVAKNVRPGRLHQEKLLKLRRLRSRGLIDPDEYLRAKGRLRP